MTSPLTRHERLADLYGHCLRDMPHRNDCYWGTDNRGNYNGCLKTGWVGRSCPHWLPMSADDPLMIRLRSSLEVIEVAG